jgi:hypothetical protein
MCPTTDRGNDPTVERDETRRESVHSIVRVPIVVMGTDRPRRCTITSGRRWYIRNPPTHSVEVETRSDDQGWMNSLVQEREAHNLRKEV